MRVAVVTPTYPRRLDWLAQCHASVRAQTHPCTHILVADGGEPHGLADFDGQFIALHRKHNDYGNTPRTVASLSAAAQGFDAICYLDDDNWYSPNHVETMVALHRQTGASVCSTPRLLYDPQDVLFGKDPQSDGVHLVDTNCYFVAKPAFDMLTVWALVPPEFCYVTDFYFDEKQGRVILNDIFHFQPKGMQPDGELAGEWVMNKKKPTFYHKFEKRMVKLPDGFFENI